MLGWIAVGLMAGLGPVVLVLAYRWLVGRSPASDARHVLRSAGFALAWTAWAIGVVVVLPISEGLRGDLLSLMGIVLSGTLALSSTRCN